MSGIEINKNLKIAIEASLKAGQAICNAVGVQVISEDTKQPLLYNKENLLNPWFVISKH